MVTSHKSSVLVLCWELDERKTRPSHNTKTRGGDVIMVVLMELLFLKLLLVVNLEDHPG